MDNMCSTGIITQVQWQIRLIASIHANIGRLMRTHGLRSRSLCRASISSCWLAGGCGCWRTRRSMTSHRCSVGESADSANSCPPIPPSTKCHVLLNATRRRSFASSALHRSLHPPSVTSSWTQQAAVRSPLLLSTDPSIHQVSRPPERNKTPFVRLFCSPQIPPSTKCHVLLNATRRRSFASSTVHRSFPPPSVTSSWTQQDAVRSPLLLSTDHSLHQMSRPPERN